MGLVARGRSARFPLRLAPLIFCVVELESVSGIVQGVCPSCASSSVIGILGVGEHSCCDSHFPSEPSRTDTSLDAPHFRQVDFITARPSWSYASSLSKLLHSPGIEKNYPTPLARPIPLSGQFAYTGQGTPVAGNPRCCVSVCRVCRKSELLLLRGGGGLRCALGQVVGEQVGVHRFDYGLPALNLLANV